MLKRWKEWIQHDVRKILLSCYALIALTLYFGYFTGLVFPWVGIAVLIVGIILALAYLAWITS